MSQDPPLSALSASPFGQAMARRARTRGSGTWESAVTTGEFAAIRSAGFLAVGRVLAAAYDTGLADEYRCPARASGHPSLSRGYGAAQTEVSSFGNPDGTFTARVRAMYEARRNALGRLVEECSALGGHGVVGVRLTIGASPAGGAELGEFNASGTAVRAPGAPPLAQPFTSELPGQDFARLMMKGWVPVGLVFGIAIGARHDDSTTRDETQQDTGNTEIGGYTHLINATRHDARRELAQDVRRLGAEGVVVTDMDLRARERKCPTSKRGHDHIVEAATIGTAITRFSQSAETAGVPELAIMSLSDRQTGGVTFGPGPRV